MIIMINIVTAIQDENKNANICILKLQSHRQDLYSSPSEIRPVAEGYSLLSLNLPPCFWVLVLQKEPTLQDVSGFDAELYQVSATNILHQQIIVEWNTIQNRTLQQGTAHDSTIQQSTVQCSTVRYSTVQRSAVQCSTLQQSGVHYMKALYSTVQCNIVHQKIFK